MTPPPSPPDASPPAPPPLDLLTIGRVSVDLYAEQLHADARAVETFRKSVGGTATNVAVAAARLGRRAAVCTRVGDDEFGGYVRHALAHTFGVDTRFVGTDPELRTPLAFAFLDPPEDPRLVFYRVPHAPDERITLADLDLAEVERTSILWIAASNFAFEPSCATMHAVLAHRRRRTHTVLDLDWRPMFWDSPARATAELGRALELATLAIGNRAECEIAVGTADPDEAADRLLDRGLEAVVVKLGGDGVLVADRTGLRQRVAPVPVEVVCGLGAGDAFGGALCHGLLAGWDLPTCAHLANAAGAIVASRLMCADAMPTLGELADLAGPLPEAGTATTR